MMTDFLNQNFSMSEDDGKNIFEVLKGKTKTKTKAKTETSQAMILYPAEISFKN